MHSSKDLALQSLTVREREILALMAQGKSNMGISTTIFITEGAVEKHTSNIMSKLGLINEETSNRRVLAAIRYLNR
jgi:DNA-binding NarL/FixJ family response regulator